MDGNLKVESTSIRFYQQAKGTHSSVVADDGGLREHDWHHQHDSLNRHFIHKTARPSYHTDVRSLAPMSAFTKQIH